MSHMDATCASCTRYAAPCDAGRAQRYLHVANNTKIFFGPSIPTMLGWDQAAGVSGGGRSVS